MTTKSYRIAVERLRGQKNLLSKQIKFAKQKIWKLQREEVNCHKARVLIQIVAKQTQKQLQFRLSELSKLALEAVFDDPYDFQIEFEQRRGRTEADFWFLRRGEKIDPAGNAGLGAVDIVGMALRTSLWSLRRPRSRASIWLDEPFSRLKGEEANKRALAILREICRPQPNRLWGGVQMVMIGDERASREELIEHADRVYEVKKLKTCSVVEKLS